MRSLFFIAALICVLTANAQNKIVEDFESGAKLQWKEFADKSGAVIVKEGVLDLESRKKTKIVKTSAKLPIFGSYDFKITTKLIIPKFNKLTGLDIMLFSVGGDSFNVGLMPNKIYYTAEGKVNFNKIKLPKGKDKTMEVVIEARGNDFIVSVNNVELLQTQKKVNPNSILFDTNSHIKIDEIIIEQEYTGDSEEQ